MAKAQNTVDAEYAVPRATMGPTSDTNAPVGERVRRPRVEGTPVWYWACEMSGLFGNMVTYGIWRDWIRVPLGENSSRYASTLPVPRGAAPSPTRDTSMLLNEKGTAGTVQGDCVGVAEAGEGVADNDTGV